MTSSLFATTLFASFFVVALPHVLPCPAPRVAFADGESIEAGSDGKRRRKRKARPTLNEEEGSKPESRSVADGVTGRYTARPDEADDEILRAVEAKQRECPVPKPRGVLGELLGFSSAKEKEEDTRRPKR
jgi:cytochrome c oxidase assembly factor 2